MIPASQCPLNHGNLGGAPLTSTPTSAPCPCPALPPPHLQASPGREQAPFSSVGNLAPPKLHETPSVFCLQKLCVTLCRRGGLEHAHGFSAAQQASSSQGTRHLSPLQIGTPTAYITWVGGAGCQNVILSFKVSDRLELFRKQHSQKRPPRNPSVPYASGCCPCRPPAHVIPTVDLLFYCFKCAFESCFKSFTETRQETDRKANRTNEIRRPDGTKGSRRHGREGIESGAGRLSSAHGGYRESLPISLSGAGASRITGKSFSAKGHGEMGDSGDLAMALSPPAAVGTEISKH